MSRLNVVERQREGRTGEQCKTLGRLVGWSEKLIEPGNSWFSPKQLLGWRRVFLLGVEHWKVWTGRKTARPIKLRIPVVIARQLVYGG